MAIPARTPVIHPTAFIAPGAVVLGDVTLGPRSSVWYQAVLRGDMAPIVVGVPLDLTGGWGAQVVFTLLFAASVLAWTRVALAFGNRAALVTAVALILYPGYGSLFHELASDAVAAAAFAGWALTLRRAVARPTAARFAVVGLMVAAAALARPGNQALVALAIVPLALSIPLRQRIACVVTCVAAAAVVLGGWAVNNGLRYDDYTVALQRTTASRDGKDYESFDVLVDRLENGEAVETWVWVQNQYEADELLA